MMENKVIFLQDSDLLVSDIKNACISTDKTIGVNKLNCLKGVSLLLEGTVLPYYHPEEMKRVTNEIINATVQDCLSNFLPEDNINSVDHLYHTLSMRDNFRKQIDPLYKNKGIKKYNSFMNPEIRQFIIDEYGIYDRTNNPSGTVFVGSNFEADDRIGIAATYFYRKFLSEGFNPIIIVCSEDKDMKTIPNIYIYNPTNQEFFYNDYLSATKFWLAQILAGDIADNVIVTPKQFDYKTGTLNKNGFGMKTAMKFVEERLNHGIKHTYNCIKDLYIKSGIESQCEINAQLLRILTIDYFDPINQEAVIFNEGMLDRLDEEFVFEMDKINTSRK